MNKIRRRLAFVLALIMLIGMVPVNTPAATKIVFKQEREYVYDNGKDKGQYVYTLKNVSKGQKVKWSVSGAGKKFVTLKFSERTITGKTTSNRIYIKTNEDVESKNARFKLTAKVYSEKGKLVETVSTISTIRTLSKSLNIVGEALGEEILPTGVGCMFVTEITPANCTEDVEWTVLDSDGFDVSSYISDDGEFQADVPGTYTVIATTYNDGTKRKTASQTIVVEDAISEIAQTAINGFDIKFYGNIGKRFDLKNLVITGSDRSNLIAKDAQMSVNGTVQVTTHSNFDNGVTYTVSYGNTSVSFIASVGAPTTLQILTDKVTVNKLTPIRYILLDKNGIDVTSLYPGKIEYKPVLTNGIIDDNNMILMKTIGTSGTIHAVFTPSGEYLEPIEGEGSVVCVGVSSSDKRNFTITESKDKPDYSASSYKDQRNVYIGKKGYIHFRALDEEGDEMKYDSVSYESLDTDTLIVQKSGEVIPIKKGTVKVIVTAEMNGVKHSYNYEVVVSESPVLTIIELDKTTVQVSNLANIDNREYIKITAFDQFLAQYELTKETVSFTKPSSTYAPAVSYDAELNRVVINPSSKLPGTYDYQITVSSEGKSVSARFKVVVSNVPTSGTLTYQVELEESVVDVALNSGTTMADQCNSLRVKKYRDGIFVGYQAFSVSSITKDGKYYGNMLTNGPTGGLHTFSNTLKLDLFTRRMTDYNDLTCNCVKAEAGTYVINISYNCSDTVSTAKENAEVAFTVIDSTDSITANVERTTSSETCKTALDLAKNCISVKNGEITDCVVIGEDKPGSQVSIASQDSYHIKEITVAKITEIANGIKAKEINKVAIGKTLTNK